MNERQRNSGATSISGFMGDLSTDGRGLVTPVTARTGEVDVGVAKSQELDRAKGDHVTAARQANLRLVGFTGARFAPQAVEVHGVIERHPCRWRMALGGPSGTAVMPG